MFPLSGIFLSKSSCCCPMSSFISNYSIHLSGLTLASSNQIGTQSKKLGLSILSLRRKIASLKAYPGGKCSETKTFNCLMLMFLSLCISAPFIKQSCIESVKFLREFCSRKLCFGISYLNQKGRLVSKLQRSLWGFVLEKFISLLLI